MFKVGDKVKCIVSGGSSGLLFNNHIYTVKDITCTCIRLNNVPCLWSSGRFELVKEEEVKPLDLSKKYVNRDGDNVELFAFKDDRYWGRTKHSTAWYSQSWPKYDHGLSVKKERIKRTYWLVHHANGENSAYTTEKAANYWENHPPILAITGPHTVEFEVEEK